MGSNFFRKARRIGVYACVSLPRNEENSAKKVQVPNPNSKIWLQSVPVEHKLVSNRQWFIMLVKFLNFRYASSWIPCLYGSRGQISDCSDCIGCKRSCTFTCYLVTEQDKRAWYIYHMQARMSTPFSQLFHNQVGKYQSCKTSKYKVFFFKSFFKKKET